jgi:hypothetical protein
VQLNCDSLALKVTSYLSVTCFVERTLAWMAVVTKV